MHLAGTLNEFENQNHLKLTKHHIADPLWDSTLLGYLWHLGHSCSSLSLGWEFYVSSGLNIFLVKKFLYISYISIIFILNIVFHFLC